MKKFFIQRIALFIIVPALIYFGILMAFVITGNEIQNNHVTNFLLIPFFIIIAAIIFMLTIDGKLIKTTQLWEPKVNKFNIAILLFLTLIGMMVITYNLSMKATPECEMETINANTTIPQKNKIRIKELKLDEDAERIYVDGHSIENQWKKGPDNTTYNTKAYRPVSGRPNVWVLWEGTSEKFGQNDYSVGKSLLDKTKEIALSNNILTNQLFIRDEVKDGTAEALGYYVDKNFSAKDIIILKIPDDVSQGLSWITILMVLFFIVVLLFFLNLLRLMAREKEV